MKPRAPKTVKLDETGNFPPVGDIKLSKLKNSYNTYKLELSYGQMECIVQALQAKHDDSLADELLAMFNYYMHELPGPGEEEDEVEAKKDAVAGAEQTGEDDLPLPMPPGNKTAEPGDEDALPELPPGPPDDEDEGTKTQGSEDADEILAAFSGDQDAEQNTDELLPEPPAE